MDTSVNYPAAAYSGTISPAEKVAITLRWTYGLVPIVAGTDKFFHLLVNWDQYLAPIVTDILPLSVNTFMTIVGIIEIVAGILVLVKPRVGSLIVGIWLIGIAINLVLTGQYFDIAVRDAVMAIGAFCLYILVADKKK
ncbi:MAG TPA: DoxX family protein [Sphingobacteriaceae bacterium]